MRQILHSLFVLAAVLPAAAQAAYLNYANMTVGLPAGAPVFSQQVLFNVIDAPSADASEHHDNSTHIFYSDGPSVSLDFDLQASYAISAVHFWNNHFEAQDVDDLDLFFYDAGHHLVRSVLNIQPALGGTGSTPGPSEVFPQHFALQAAPVRYVHVVLAGSNGVLDFNNIGFTGELVSSVPEPGSMAMLLAGVVAVAGAVRRR